MRLESRAIEPACWWQVMGDEYPLNHIAWLFGEIIQQKR
jgi:hypothetical protein